MRRSFATLGLFILPLLIFCDKLPAEELNQMSLALSLPDLSWSLEVNEPGFTVEQKEIAASGDAARLQAVNSKTGVVLSAFLERAARTGDSKECREYYWSKAEKSPFKKEQITMYESGPISVVKYIIPEYQGVNMSQKNVNGYLAVEGYWIDVHLSKASYREEGEDPLLPILKNIRINKDYIPTAFDHFQYGSLFYSTKDYKKAAFHYEKALELEKHKASLNRNEWKILVDQLGISYGISGELTKARSLFEWAITQEPEYPLFHYNLACAFAEMGNREQALTSLRMAYKYKDKVLPGESLPKPEEDSSFTKYLQDNEFKAELDRMR
jgi:tetratricopeptide (TPR) repeat protein